MDPSIEAVRPHVAMLCRRLGIRGLDVLGSGGDDVTLVVDLGAAPDDRLDVHAALKRSLEQMLGRPVELVEAPGPDPDEHRETLYPG